MMDQHQRDGAAGRKITWWGAAVNALLIVIKFAAGVLGGSQALIADAVHSVSDFFTDAVVLVGLALGRKAADEDHHFGHGRIETLAAAVVGLALLAVAFYIGYSAAMNIYGHVEHHPTPITIVAAALSIALKEVLYQYTVRVGRRIRSAAVVANAWHHRSDAFSSVAVLIGVAGAQIRPEWHVLDPLAALLVSFFIVKVGLEILREAVIELSDAAPGSQVVTQIARTVAAVDGVEHVHALKVRRVGGAILVQVHIVVDGDLTVRDGHSLALEVERRVRDDVDDVTEILVHVDPELDEPGLANVS